MTDDANRQENDSNLPAYKKIRRDLLRTAIKQPLLNMILDENQKEPLPVILEANDEYYLGKAKAVEQTRKLVEAAGVADCPSIGSDQNPYYKASLTKKQIIEIVRKDDENAQNRTSDVEDGAAAKVPAGSDGKNSVLPPQVMRYLANSPYLVQPPHQSLD